MLGIVRALALPEITVEVYTAQGGGSFVLTAPAVLHAAYAVGDRVLVLFQSLDPDSAVIAGRVGNEDDTFSAQGVLAKLLGVDGSGSGLDADTLDGQHESALLRADGSRPLSADWDVGAGRTLRAQTVRARSSSGLALEDDAAAVGLFVEDGGHVGVGHRAPQCPLDVKLAGDGLMAILLADDGSDSAGMAFYGFTDDYATSYLANSTVLYATAGTTALILAAANSAGEIRFTTGGFPGSTLERMRLTAAGLGIGTQSPQGRLHVWDGTGGHLCAGRTAVGSTAQLLVAAGTGGVSQMARVEALVNNGSQTVFQAFTLDATLPTLSVAVGSDSYQFRRNSDASLDVRRISGSNPATVVARLMWL